VFGQINLKKMKKIMKSNTPTSSFKEYREICVYLFKFIYAVGCCTIRALQQLDEGDEKISWSGNLS